MPSNSEIILTAQTHPGDSSIQTVTGDKYKGDGYYGRSDGFHSIQYTFDGLTGSIIIEGTLAIDPTDDDWFEIHSYTAAQESDSKIANFTGNYVWVRSVVTYTDGTINSIVLNH